MLRGRDRLDNIMSTGSLGEVKQGKTQKERAERFGIFHIFHVLLLPSDVACLCLKETAVTLKLLTPLLWKGCRQE